MEKSILYTKEIPYYGHFDIIVLGGGPAGVCAAIDAGKTISCESQAAGGLRCMPCAMAMGQASGVAAALTVTNKCTPEKIDIDTLQSILKKKGAILD